MDKIPLTIEMPQIDGETAAAIQEFLYAVLNAFDAQYCFTIERYYKEISSQNHNNQIVNELKDNEVPF
jgi:hypothetical protein